MARDIHINGESMVTVKGASDSAIGSLSQLGLAEGPIVVSLQFNHSDINVDAWGGLEGPPVDVQWMLAEAIVNMDLIHFDRTVLEACLALSMGGASLATTGQMARAGSRLGNNKARFAAGINLMGLNIASPQEGKPWRFYHAYIVSGYEYALGTKRTAARVTWRVIPYTQDPWNSGSGAANYQLWDHTADA